VANGTERCFVNVLTAKGATFAGNVFGVDRAVVDDKLSSLAKVAGNVKIQMGLVLIVTGWTNLTVEILVVEENSSGRTGFAVGVASARVGGTNGADCAIELPRSVVVLPSAATFAGNGFGGLTDLLVVFAGAAILTSSGFRRLSNLRVVLAGAAILTGNGFGRLSNLIVVSIVLASATIFALSLPNLRVVLAGATILTSCGFRGLSDEIVVLACSAILTGNGFR